MSCPVQFQLGYRFNGILHFRLSTDCDFTSSLKESPSIYCSIAYTEVFLFPLMFVLSLLMFTHLVSSLTEHAG